MVWDSLAIAETLAERHPDVALLADRPGGARRWRASLAAEMHAGFRALRDACPMNLRRAYAGFEPPEAVRADLARIEALWAAARAARRRTAPGSSATTRLADAFFAPVAARIATYGLPVGPEAAAYVARPPRRPRVPRMAAMGLADPVVQPHYELDLPERPWPGPVGLRPLRRASPAAAPRSSRRCRRAPPPCRGRSGGRGSGPRRASASCRPSRRGRGRTRCPGRPSPGRRCRA